MDKIVVDDASNVSVLLCFSLATSAFFLPRGTMQLSIGGTI